MGCFFLSWLTEIWNREWVALKLKHNSQLCTHLITWFCLIFLFIHRHKLITHHVTKKSNPIVCLPNISWKIFNVTTAVSCFLRHCFLILLVDVVYLETIDFTVSFQLHSNAFTNNRVHQKIFPWFENETLTKI